MQIRFSWVMPAAAGGHKIVPGDISPCQILANVVNSIGPCKCASTLSFINDNTMLLPFLSPFNFWIGSDSGFILTLQKASAKLKGMHSVYSPIIQINLGSAVPPRFACCGEQMMWKREGNTWVSRQEWTVASWAGITFLCFLGFMVGCPFSSTLILRSFLRIVQKSNCTRAMLITGYEW